MKDLIIDSDILIDHLRGNTQATRFLESIIDKNCKIFYSVITKTEIYAGTRKGEEEKTAKLFNTLNYINFDDEMAAIAGNYLNKFRRAYNLNIGDVIIAATARTRSLRLVTRNRKHYPMKDIKVIIPY